mgnify:CR=1 FL=1
MSKDGVVYAESLDGQTEGKIIFKGVLTGNPITKTLDSILSLERF